MRITVPSPRWGRACAAGRATLALPLALVLALAAAYAPESRAAFGDCGDTAYVETFDPRIAADPFGCVERVRVAVATPGGTRHIRVVEGFAADWSYEAGYPEAVEEGVRATAEALDELGRFRMDDVTVLLVDDLPALNPGERDRSHMLGTAGAPVDDECRVAMYPLARGGTGYVAFTVAHELFHCVQYATAGRERVLTVTRDGAEAGGDWWVEGSAEWFAELAVPGTDELDDRVADFDALSMNTPLYEMAYEAVPFFLWLAGEEGAGAVTALLPRMAAASSAEAQQEAMGRILADGEWLDFGKTYLDSDIRGPGGDPIGSDPVTFRTEIEEPATLTRTLEPFVLDRRALHFLCGRWTLAHAPGDANLESREPGGAWGAPPARINGKDADDNDHLFATVNTGTGDVELELEIEVEASCEPCGEADEVDSCLVDRWRRTGGGGIEWVRRQLPPDISIPRFEESGLTVEFRADGTYLSRRYEAEMSTRARTSEGVYRGEGHITSQSAGRWSAHDGTLVMCPDAESVSGRMTVTLPSGGTMSAPMGRYAGRRSGGEMSYTCSGSRVRTEMVFPTSPDPLVTTYTRLESDEETPEEGPLVEVDDL